MAEQEYLTTGEAAALLRSHPDTVRDRALAGTLPCVKNGRRWLFPRAELVAMLAVQATGQRPRVQRTAPPIEMPAARQAVQFDDQTPVIVLFPNASWRTEEERRAIDAASPAAGRSRSADTKRARSVSR